MTRIGNRGLRPYLATLAAVVALAGTALASGVGASSATAAADPTASAPNWSTLSPPARPPALAYAAEAFDPANQTVVLFGGIDPGGSLSGATWIWNGTTWSEAAAQVSSPPPRELASLAYFPGAHGQLILFGGEGAGGTPLGDTWAWNGQSWVPMTTAQAAGPAARFGASLAQDAAGNLVLFGGTGADQAVHGPMAAPTSSTSSTTSTTTQAVSADAGSAGDVATTTAPGAPAATQGNTTAGGAATPATSATTAPPTTPTTEGTTPPSAAAAELPASQPVDSASAAGNSGPTTLADTWVWNGNGWSQPDVTTAPEARTGASLVWDPQIGQTVLFGGSANPTAGASATPIGDTWVWSGSAWTPVNPTESPPARYDAAGGSAGTLGGDLLIGGSGASGERSDAWSFTGATWNPLSTTGALTARSGAAAAGNPAGSLMIFGGVGAGGNLDDTDVLTPAAPVKVVPTPAQTSGGSTPTGSGGSTSAPPTGAASSQATSAQATAPEQTGTASKATAKPTSSAPRTANATHPSSTSPAATARSTTTPPATAPSTLGPGTGARITSGSGTQQSATGAGTNQGSVPTGNSRGLRTSPNLQTVRSGSLVTVLGSGFEPGATITITFHSRPSMVGRAVARPDGTFSATVTVPLDASPGHHHLEASGMGPHGRMTVLLTPLLVVGSIVPSAAGTSTETTIIMVAVSIFLPIGTWIVLGVWSKRRRRPAANP